MEVLNAYWHWMMAGVGLIAGYAGWRARAEAKMDSLVKELTRLQTEVEKDLTKLDREVAHMKEERSSDRAALTGIQTQLTSIMAALSEIKGALDHKVNREELTR